MKKSIVLITLLFLLPVLVTRSIAGRGMTGQERQLMIFALRAVAIPVVWIVPS